MTTYYPINENLARASHDMRSMSTYPDGYATREYRASVDKAAALVEEKKQKVSPYYHEKLDALLDSYARRLAQWTDDHNRNGASCPSVLVCGAGNFPVRKKQKQNAREDTLWHEYEEIEAILTKIKAVGTGPVDLADPHARELLTDQLNKEQDLLEYCKGANAYYRKHKTLRGYSNMSDAAADALTNPDAFSMSLYRKPYGDFELTSIRGKIKRIQTRLDELDKVQAAAASGPVEDQHDGYTYRENNEIMRVQFIFPGKPDDEPAPCSKRTVSGGHPVRALGSASLPQTPNMQRTVSWSFWTATKTNNKSGHPSRAAPIQSGPAPSSRHKCREHHENEKEL